MNSRELLDALSVAERLKDTTRHCYTSKGRHESVAEHSWMMTLMAFFMRDEFPNADMDKVIRMCIIHDLGECFTGDIPTFSKEQVHEDIEENLLFNWIETLPAYYAEEMKALYNEMAERETVEAKIYKAIDSLEALILQVRSEQNESPDNVPAHESESVRYGRISDPRIIRSSYCQDGLLKNGS